MNIPKNNQSGVAMIMALSAITILAILAAELVYETQVYHRIVYNSIDQVRAHYLVKSGLALARLQIIGAEKAITAVKNLGANTTVNQSDIDLIWQTPIILPPPLPPGADLILKDKVNKLSNELGLQGTIAVSIQGESSKLNFNQLIWQPPVKPAGPAPKTNSTTPPTTIPTAQPLSPQDYKINIRKTFTATLESLLKQKKDENNDFAIKYEALTADNIIGNILAWIDAKAELDGENAPKEAYYRQQSSPYSIKNAPLFSISELSMIKDIDDEMASYLSQYFTALVTEGININRVPTEIIKGIFPSISEENLKKIKEKRELSPFEKLEDFWKFMQSELGYNEEAKKEFDATGIVITTKETAYRVQVTGSSGESQKNWLAYIGLAPPKPANPSNPPGSTPIPALIDPNNPDSNNDPNKAKTQSNDNSAPTIIYLKTD